MDLRILWRKRERAKLLTGRCFRLWAKRIATGPGLMRIFASKARLRSRGAQIGSLSVISFADIEGKLSLFKVGKCAFVGRAHISVHATVSIGDYAVISDFATLLTGSHALDDPDWPLVAEPIVIGDYAWVGQGAMILPGVTLGKGAVVGAGSVVARDVDPFTVVAGNPAQPVGSKREGGLRYVPVARVAPFAAWLGANTGNLESD
jgi:acetyltransferase-like isoleucine patch superfamily enzyme